MTNNLALLTKRRSLEKTQTMMTVLMEPSTLIAIMRMQLMHLAM